MEIVPDQTIMQAYLQLSKLPYTGSYFDTKQAQQNKDKNRYVDILPYDGNRVQLSTGEYVNASHITDKYIATQGPLQHTIQDFWQIVLDNDIPSIVMLTAVQDSGRIKCDQYWGQPQYGSVSVAVAKEQQVGSLVKRVFEVSQGSKQLRVQQFQYLGWPDHSVPESPQDVIKLIRQVPQGKQLVHCSAGCGRTGTYIAIARYIQDGGDMFEIVKDGRYKRHRMVESPKQLELCMKAVQMLK